MVPSVSVHRPWILVRGVGSAWEYKMVITVSLNALDTYDTKYK